MHNVKWSIECMRKIKCECQKCHGNDAFSIQYILENKSEFSESIIDFVEYMVTDFKRSISCPQKPIKKEKML